MSQEREMIVTRELDVPQGGGWKLTHVRGNDESSPLIFVWVREPVPDAWQDYATGSGVLMTEYAPDGYEAMGPWVPFAGSMYTEHDYRGDDLVPCQDYPQTHWRRPLRKIEGGEG
jgi:hypothetical protein